VCGIVGYIGPNQVGPVILDGVKRLEHRGYDSAGVAVVNQDGTIEIRRSSGKLRNLAKSVTVE
jgi:glucosamine--fructose-6-phosphate aminotransferase (isomerizing)